MASSRALAGWLMASLTVAACSLHHNGLGAVEEGDDGGGLVGQPGSGGAETGGSAAGGAGGSVGTGGSAAGGNPGTGGSLAPDAAPLPGDAAPRPPSPDAASLPADAPPLAPDLAPLPRDTAPPPGSGIIACGALKCVAGKEACCATAAGTSCIPVNGFCLGGSVFRCDGPEDCDGGRVCCLRAEGGGYRSACVRAAECAQSAGAAICRTGADCPSGTSCASSSNAMISVCR